jgi:hypothetical protein
MLIGAAFRISISETFLLIPAIVNAGLLLSIQDFPWGIYRRIRPTVMDEERQEHLILPRVVNSHLAEVPPLSLSSLGSNEPAEDRTGH